MAEGGVYGGGVVGSGGVQSGSGVMDSLEAVSSGPWTGGWGEVTVVVYVLGDQVNGGLRRVSVVLLTLSLFLVQGEKPWCECLDLPLSWLMIGGLTTSVRSLSWCW